MSGQENPALTPDQIRQLLRECVTVVKPGETLIIRAHYEWTAGQIREVQDVLNEVHDWWDLKFRTIVVPGAELGIAEADSA